MADLGDLGKRLKLLAQAVEVNATEAVKDVAKAVGPVVVYATPVDTSRARANWQGNVGQPKTDVLFAYPEKPVSPDEGGILATRSIIDATAAYSGQSEGIFITNNLYYIINLNSGSSAQAPANFVELGVSAAMASLKSIRLLK